MKWHAIKKRVLILYTISFLCFHHLITTHGFASHTIVHLENTLQKTIHSLCLHALRNITHVASYDMHTTYTASQRVTKIGQSESNCYIRLSFDHDSTNDLMCTSTQEFYVPTNNQWIPAYMLKLGDALLTKDMTTIPIAYKELVPKQIKVDMIEIQNEHTFFVGKYAVLTHNNFLPVAMNLGFVVPFGSVATGSVGSFFGPIGLLAGFAIGGIIGITIKAICRNRIPHYKIPTFNISFIKNSCDNITVSPQNVPATSTACFSIQDSLAISCIYPVENPSSHSPVGCVEITPHIPDNFNTRSWNKNHDTKEPQHNGCFSPDKKEKTPCKKQEKIPPKENRTSSSQKPTARNWKEFEENCHIGQKYGKKFTHTGKQNPKDGSPIRKLTEDIPHAEMFKKDYHFALDRFHEGDHFEVWDKRGNWIGVANLDGSKNTEKSNMVKNKNTRDIKDIL